MEKIYRLVDSSGKEYESKMPGNFGGHKRLKIYGRLDCKSAARYIEKDSMYSIEYFCK